MDDFNLQLNAFAQKILHKNLPQEPKADSHATSEEAPEKEVVLYQTENGNINVSVFFHNETFWLTQKAIGELFQVDRSVITKHLSNIFKDGELDKDSVCAIFAHTASEGFLRQKPEGKGVSRMASQEKRNRPDNKLYPLLPGGEGKTAGKGISWDRYVYLSKMRNLQRNSGETEKYRKI